MSRRYPLTHEETEMAMREVHALVESRHRAGTASAFLTRCGERLAQPAGSWGDWDQGGES
jgi:hypothetical protein